MLFLQSRGQMPGFEPRQEMMSNLRPHLRPAASYKWAMFNTQARGSNTHPAPTFVELLKFRLQTGNLGHRQISCPVGGTILNSATTIPRRNAGQPQRLPGVASHP